MAKIAPNREAYADGRKDFAAGLSFYYASNPWREKRLALGESGQFDWEQGWLDAYNEKMKQQRIKIAK